MNYKILPYRQTTAQPTLNGGPDCNRLQLFVNKILYVRKRYIGINFEVKCSKCAKNGKHPSSISDMII